MEKKFPLFVRIPVWIVVIALVLIMVDAFLGWYSPEPGVNRISMALPWVIDHFSVLFVGGIVIVIALLRRK